MAIFTILYGDYYPPNEEFKLICIGKFARRIWVNFTQQYGKNRQRCQQNAFYYAVWQLLLYFYREFPSKILSVYVSKYSVYIRNQRLFIETKSFCSAIFIMLISMFWLWIRNQQCDIPQDIEFQHIKWECVNFCENIDFIEIKNCWVLSDNIK